MRNLLICRFVELLIEEDGVAVMREINKSTNQ